MSTELCGFMEAARRALSSVCPEGVEAALVWGSAAEAHEQDSRLADLDVLAIKRRLRFADSVNARHMFGVPVRSVVVDDRRIDLFIVDRDYVEAAVRQGHWTVIRAIQRGVSLVDNGLIGELRALCPDYRAFALSTAREWRNQAQSLLDKARDSTDSGDIETGVLLARHAVDAVVQALLMALDDEPPRPRTFLARLKAIPASPEIAARYARIQGINSLAEGDAYRTCLLAMEFLQICDAMLARVGDNEAGTASGAR